MRAGRQDAGEAGGEIPSTPCSWRFAPSWRNGLKGMAIGMANVVPGVSGGTVAAMTGIYEDLVEAFGTLFKGDGRWKSRWAFLAPVILGALLGNVLLARVVGRGLAVAPERMHMGFSGLMLGSLPFLFRRSGIRRLRPGYALPGIAGFLLVVGMGWVRLPAEPPPMMDLSALFGVRIFAAAFVSGVAMAVPGVSGGFLLMLMGMYGAFQNGFATMNIPVMLLFTIGTLTGALLFARLASDLLRRFHAGCYAVIIGLVAGSAAGLFPGFRPGAAGWGDGLALAAGVGLSYGLGARSKPLPARGESAP